MIVQGEASSERRKPQASNYMRDWIFLKLMRQVERQQQTQWEASWLAAKPKVTSSVNHLHLN